MCVLGVGAAGEGWGVVAAGCRRGQDAVITEWGGGGGLRSGPLRTLRWCPSSLKAR
jgi:hypothetical protein